MLNIRQFKSKLYYKRKDMFETTLISLLFVLKVKDLPCEVYMVYVEYQRVRFVLR